MKITQAFAAFAAVTIAARQEKVADFFEPVRYDDPSPDTIAGRLAAREYSEQITDED